MKNCKPAVWRALILIVILVHSAQAQSFKFQNMPQDQTQYEIRFLKPNFDGDADLSFFTGVYDLTINVPATPTVNVVLSVPYGNYSYEGESESGIGNLYVGIQNRAMMDHGSGTSYALGLFLPTTSENDVIVQSVGIYTNAYEWQKFIPNTLTVYGNFSYIKKQANGPLFGIEFGPNVWIPTEDGDSRDTDFLLHYGVKAGLGAGKVTFLAEFTGVAILTGDADSFDERTLHALAVGARLNLDSVAPSIFYEAPLDDDLSYILDNVIGFKLEKPLN